MISLKTFQKKYNHHISKGLSFYKISNWPENFNIDFDVFLPSKGLNLQRGYVWTIEQKRAFILSVLKDQKCPSIVVVQHDLRGTMNRGDSQWQIIDGKQRLSTILNYIDNKFPIVIEEGIFFFKDLPKDCQQQIEFFNLTVDVHYSYQSKPISDDTKISLFEDCNWLGTPQDIEHFKRIKNGHKCV